MRRGASLVSGLVVLGGLAGAPAALRAQAAKQPVYVGARACAHIRGAFTWEHAVQIAEARLLALRNRAPRRERAGEPPFGSSADAATLGRGHAEVPHALAPTATAP